MTSRLLRPSFRLAAVVLLALASGASLAQPAAPTSGPRWESLNPAQQQALAPLQRDWPTIDADRKAKWLEVAARFPKMPTEERTRIQERMAEWSRLSPAQRGEARLQFQQARQLPATERQARWDAYQALSEDERRELARRALPATGGSNGKPATTATTAVAKRNIVLPPPAATPRAVSPTVVQSRTGATTTLLSPQPQLPPAHQQAGLPKIAATKDFVQPKTLLPKRGPQGAAVRAASAADTIDPAATPAPAQ